MTTWAECYAAGMTAAQATAERATRRSTALSWATKNGVSWPDHIDRSDRQAIRPCVQSSYSHAHGYGQPASIPRAPWGDIEIGDRPDSAPRTDGLLSRASRLYRRDTGISPGAITAIIRDMHREATA